MERCCHAERSPMEIDCQWPATAATYTWDGTASIQSSPAYWPISKQQLDGSRHCHDVLAALRHVRSKVTPTRWHVAMTQRRRNGRPIGGFGVCVRHCVFSQTAQFKLIAASSEAFEKPLADTRRGLLCPFSLPSSTTVTSPLFNWCSCLDRFTRCLTGNPTVTQLE